MGVWSAADREKELLLTGGGGRKPAEGGEGPPACICARKGLPSACRRGHDSPEDSVVRLAASAQIGTVWARCSPSQTTRQIRHARRALFNSHRQFLSVYRDICMFSYALCTSALVFAYVSDSYAALPDLTAAASCLLKVCVFSPINIPQQLILTDFW